MKLGFMKQFFTTLDKESAAFKKPRDFFSKLSEAKVKADDLVRPQIRMPWSAQNPPKIDDRPILMACKSI